MAKVSVVIPVYNEEDVIGECLSSLAGQSGVTLEVIIVDDGSTDDTVRAVKDTPNLHFPIKVFKQHHKGPGEARNLGASKATSDILVFVDADMTFDKSFIKDLIAPIQKGEAKGTFSKNELVSNPDNVWSKCWSINEGWEVGRRHAKNQAETQKVFRAILANEFDRVGGFGVGGEYNDDWSLSAKLGYEAKLARGAGFYHKNPDNLAETYSQAKWIGKRKYKLGPIGYLAALARSTLPVSILVGLLKALRFANLHFIAFKVVYDWGIFVGLLEYLILGKKGR